MKNLFRYIVLVGSLGLTLFYGCKRDDDEPTIKGRSISRLYISTSDYNINSGAEPLNNVFVVDPADTLNFTKFQGQYGSAAKGGNIIHYSPYNKGLVFQSGRNVQSAIDTSIQVLSVSQYGVLGTSGVIGNRLFQQVRGLFYTVVNSGQLSQGYLMLIEASSSPSMYVIDRVTSKSGYTDYKYRMPFTFRPWGIYVDNNDVFVTKADNNGGIAVYKDFTSMFINDGPKEITREPNYVLTISGANNIRGISYAKAKDILFLTDYTEGSGQNDGTGRILIFEKFSENKTTGTITPTRIVTGPNTGLKEPLDVAVDTRDKGEFFYVADPSARAVFRFKISDTGNAAPDDKIEVKSGALSQVPQSIALDTR